MSVETLLVALTLGCFGLLLYAYLIYPALLWMVGVLAPREVRREGEPSDWPTVSVLISAYNEEQVIAERIRNLLELDYPKERLEILIGSDGSTDRTAEIASGCQAQGVRLVAFQARRGKANVLNDLVSLARGEVLLLSDANTFFQPDAARELTKALWSRPSACVVQGCLEIHSSAASGNLDGAYWRYETWLKGLESRFGAVVGGNGPIYAFRREHYQRLPEKAIVDDCLIPILIRLRFGGEVCFVPSARAWEKSPERVRDEFRRRVRIGTGDFQAVVWTWRLLLPWKGMVALTYFSHKVLRWFGPWLMLLGFTANLSLLGQPVFQLLFSGQLLFYGLGLGAGVLRQIPLLGTAAVGVRYFLVLNAGLLLGSVRFLLGAAQPIWNTTPRHA